jgi:hypothetical protein
MLTAGMSLCLVRVVKLHNEICVSLLGEASGSWILTLLTAMLA